MVRCHSSCGRTCLPSTYSEGPAGTAQKSNESGGFPRDLISSFRRGTPKSRNGCIVCKIRRVKCDETKPHCTRCTSTGRNCEGYRRVLERSKSRSRPKFLPRHTPTSPSTTALQILWAPSSDVQESMEDRQSFHFLRSRSVLEMLGNFELSFWDRIAFQLSHTHPTVMRVLISLSAIYEEHGRNHLDLLSNASGARVGCREYTLRQYNRAVKGLLEYIASEEPDTRVILTSCLIFVWIEFLQHNFNSGFRHLDSGLKILRDIRLSRRGGKVRTQDRDTDDILGSLHRSFIRLRIQAAVYGSAERDFTTSTTQELEILELIPSSFNNVIECRNNLDKELNATFGYIRRIREIGYYSSVDMLMFSGVQRLHLERLQRWQTASEVLVATLKLERDQSQTSRILYLQLYHTLVDIIWRTMFAGSEMVFDDYTADFEMMITIASSLINSQTASLQPILSLDMGIIPPLFFICLKCRVLQIRKQALALLEHAPEREGMWHRSSVIKYCEWKVMTEEQWRGEISDNDPLPEFARMYAEHVPEKAEFSGEDEPLQMTFRRGPVGLDIQDTIDVPDDLQMMMRHMGNML
ncbi:hypothetical protein F5884DRAFT_266397 [Xylogone sp. PMI_703]|nr:hypothetical protein F5884DRAFT_266397 [Xylogone sp. PMI_703]